MASQGHVEASGFSLPIADWPEAAGATVWATYDPEGLLRLPQAAIVRLPDREPVDTALLLRERQAPEAFGSTALETTLEAPLAHVEAHAEHWQALDGFRRYLDSLEREIDRQEQLRLKPPKPRPFWMRLTGSGR